MNKLVALLINLIIAPTAMATSHYIPSQLEKFYENKSCEGCDLSQAWIESVDNANLMGALLVKATLSYNTFYSSNFSNAKLMYAELNSAKFSGSNFSSADLTGADLHAANFSSCDFSQANLTGANLSHANLSWAKISIEQLAQAKTLNCALLPDGTRHSADNEKKC